eukprot:g39289.t1
MTRDIEAPFKKKKEAYVRYWLVGSNESLEEYRGYWRVKWKHLQSWVELLLLTETYLPRGTQIWDSVAAAFGSPVACIPPQDLVITLYCLTRKLGVKCYINSKMIMETCTAALVGVVDATTIFTVLKMYKTVFFLKTEQGKTHPGEGAYFSGIFLSVDPLEAFQGKSPGLDMLTMEFPRMFGDVLGCNYAWVLEEYIATRDAHFLVQGSISHPKMRDAHLLKNWGLVSLLSTNFKIFQTFSTPLSTMLTHDLPRPALCCPDQSIHDDILMVLDMIYYSQR